jgi:stage II sporulation protein P
MEAEIMGSNAARVKTRLVIYNLLVVVIMLMFSLSFRTDTALPAFGGSHTEISTPLRTPSLFDLMWGESNLPKEILKMGFSLMDYLETQAYDDPGSFLSSQILGYVLGFAPRSVADFLFGYLPGYLTEETRTAISPQASDLESDWGLSQVIYSITEMGDTHVIPVTMSVSRTPTVAVYHTHATESYLPEVGKKNPNDAFTENLSKTVVRVGEELVRYLQQQYRIPCLQSKTVHDKTGRVGAYYRSEQTVKAITGKYPDCNYLIDIHRDSQRASLTKVTIRGKSYARLLLVVGTNNPNWVSNYSTAREIVSLLEEGFPGITRGILYQSDVYNQDASPKAMLVEVGGVDNTLEECKNSMEALAWALASVILPTPPQRP